MVRNWIEILLTNGPDEPIEEALYVLYLSDNQRIEGKLDANGKLRKENLPPGEVLVEFPEFFDVVVLEDGEIVEGENCGTMPPLHLETLCKESNSSEELNDEFNEPIVQQEDEEEGEQAYVDEMEEDEEEIEDESDESRSLDSEQDDEFPIEPHLVLETLYDTEDYDREDDEIILPELDLPTPEINGNPKDDKFDVAYHRCKTGKAYHLAVINCITVHVVRPDGKPFPEPMGYEIRNDDGDLVAEGECDDGVIFVDLVGIDDYELSIGGYKYWVPSKRFASEIELIVLEEDEYMSSE
jgi:hypothetical protein